jgi:hypothetical protein
MDTLMEETRRLLSRLRPPHFVDMLLDNIIPRIPSFAFPVSIDSLTNRSSLFLNLLADCSGRRSPLEERISFVSLVF